MILKLKNQVNSTAHIDICYCYLCYALPCVAHKITKAFFQFLRLLFTQSIFQQSY